MRRGFTLMEALLSIALIGVIASIGIPIYQIFQNRNDLDIAAVTFVQSARRAQLLSRAVDGDERWGVRVDPGSITLFTGDDFPSRDQERDEVFDISGTISVSGMQETVFERFTGEPQATGTLTLTSINDETRNITINEKGRIEY